MTRKFKAQSHAVQKKGGCALIGCPTTSSQGRGTCAEVSRSKGRKKQWKQLVDMKGFVRFYIKS